MLRVLGRKYAEAYAGLPRGAWMLAGASFVASSGTMVIFFLSLYLTKELHFDPSFAGEAMSVFGIGGLAGAYLGGWLCDRLGSTRVQVLSLFLSGGLLIALSFVEGRPAILILMAAWGLAGQALFPASGAAMTRICPPELRPRGFSLQRLANNLGVTIGPVVGGYLALSDYHYLFWADGLTNIAAAVLLALVFRGRPIDGHLKEESGQRRDSPWRDQVFLLVLFLVLGLGSIFVQLFCTYPLFLRRSYGFAESQIGSVLAVNTLMIVAIEMPLIQALSRFAPGRVVALGALFLGAGFSLLSLGRGFVHAALCMAVLTVGEMLSLPMLNTLVANRAPASSVGRYQGLYSLAFTLAFVVGPVVGARTYSAWSGDVLWWAVGVLAVGLCGGFWVVHLALRSPSVVKAE